MQRTKKPPHLVEGSTHFTHLAELIRRTWHLVREHWLPGFVGPFPSTTLDERKLRFTCKDYTTCRMGVCQVAELATGRVKNRRTGARRF